jgi:hypothetical protein
MKAIMMLAAVALSIAMTHQAVACDFSREANSAPAVVAEGCSGSGCATETPTTADATTATETTTAKPAVQEATGSAQPQPAPVTTVAQQP